MKKIVAIVTLLDQTNPSKPMRIKSLYCLGSCIAVIGAAMENKLKEEFKNKDVKFKTIFCHEKISSTAFAVIETADKDFHGFGIGQGRDMKEALEDAEEKLKANLNLKSRPISRPIELFNQDAS